MIYIQVGSNNASNDKIGFTKNLISYYEATKKQQKILIIDVNNSYPEVESIDFEENDFEGFLSSAEPVGVYRFLLNGLSRRDGATLYGFILSNYRNGLLVCENPFVFYDYIPNMLVGLLATSNHRYCDILINLILLVLQ
jgi:hypothetical protein